MGDADLNLYVTEAPKFTVFRFDIEFDQIPVMSFFVVFCCLFLHSIIIIVGQHACAHVYDLSLTVYISLTFSSLPNQVVYI